MSLVSLNSLDSSPIIEVPYVKSIPSQKTKPSNYDIENLAEDIIETKDNLSPESISSWSDTESNYLKLPNSIVDNLMKSLDSSEFTVYLRLYRLSHGFRRSYCMVGYTSLSEACNLSSRQIRRIIPSLVSRNLIKVLEVYNEAQKQGTLYEVYSLDKMPTGKQNTIPKPYGQNVPRDTTSTIKIDDDPLKRQDHHQSEHEKRVMMIYQETTGNSWTKADSITYNKIKNIPLQAIETAIKLATERASNPPNSLAYFVKEIINTANPPKQNRTQRKKVLEKIVQQVRNSFIGSNYSISDFTFKVKEVCLRQDVGFDNDIFDEILTKKNP